MKNFVEENIIIFSPFLILIYTCFHFLFDNIGEADFIEILPILLIFLVFGAVLLKLMLLLLKDSMNAIFITDIILILFTNFKHFEKYLNEAVSNIGGGILYWHALIIVVFVVISTILFLKHHNIKELKNINKIIAFTFIVLIGVDVALAIPKYIELFKSLSFQQSEEVANTNTNTQIKELSEKPNFYYLIFDEYGGYENLKDSFNYDNSNFYDELKKYGFNVSYTSRNKSYATRREIPDLFNLKHVTHEKIKQAEYLELVKQPYMLQLFKQYGYKINLVTAKRSIGSKMEVEYKNTGEQKPFESCMDMILQATIIYPFITNTTSVNQKQLLLDLQYLDDTVAISKNGVLTVAHFGLPHFPFLFDKDGKPNPVYKYQDFLHDEVYLNYLQWTNSRIIQFIQKIVEKDVNSVVLIQSDHGARGLLYKHQFFNQPEPSKEKVESMKSILNILYYKGEKIDIEGLSGYATLDLAVSKILGIKAGRYE